MCISPLYEHTASRVVELATVSWRRTEEEYKMQKKKAQKNGEWMCIAARRKHPTAGEGRRADGFLSYRVLW